MFATAEDDVQVEEMWLLGQLVLVYMQCTDKISSVEMILYLRALSST